MVGVSMRIQSLSNRSPSVITGRHVHLPPVSLPSLISILCHIHHHEESILRAVSSWHRDHLLLHVPPTPGPGDKVLALPRTILVVVMPDLPQHLLSCFIRPSRVGSR